MDRRHSGRTGCRRRDVADVIERGLPTAVATALVVLCWSVVCQGATGDSGGFSNEQALAVSQGALGNIVGNHALTGSDHEPISLHQLQGKPLIISLIYSSCYHTCPIMTKNLATGVQAAAAALGKDSFSVLTVGFDSAVDTPERMRQYAREHGIGFAGWKFASAGIETITALTKDLGFLFYPSAKGFDHLAQTTIVDGQGRVYRQIYGNNFTVPQLVEPLKELMYGKSATLPVHLNDWLNNIRLFCTIYDPRNDRYYFDYSIFVAIIIGIVCLGSIFVFLIHAWCQNRPPRKHA